MQVRSFLIFAALLALFLPAHASASETLRAFVQRMLVQAPGNFSGVRGVQKDSDVYYVRYTVLPMFKSTCPKCYVNDEYAWPAHAENWYLEDRWNDSESWSTAKITNYVSGQLSPALSGYTLHKTGSKQYPNFTWSSAKNTWVYVDTFKGGFTVRVGHNLVKPVHVLLPPSETQLSALRDGVTKFVNSGVAPALDNFESLRIRGKKDFMGDMEYGVNVTFAPLLRECHVSDSTNNSMGLKDFSPKWILSCDTVPMVGTVAALEEPVRSAMWDALPSGFTATTDKSLLFMDDYRWDNTDTRVAADIDSFSTYVLPKGLVQFTLQIVHFLPKSDSGN